ncbi:MAG TPA: hypothetical protein PLP17_11885 [Oligoflexia bacterium]|nr:hypothetical protein [Oligoflexia bacterium]
MYRRQFSYWCLALFLFFCSSPAAAETAAAQSPVLRVCSQNLHRFGDPEAAAKRKTGREQQRALVRRMRQASCDIVAVQEIYGESHREAKRNLSRIARALSKASGRQFAYFTGDSFDRYIRNGFLVAADVGWIVRRQDFLYHGLPKLQPLAPADNFIRGPLLLQIALSSARVKGLSSPVNNVIVLTMHFKSKAESYKDASGTLFELLRMQMAAGLRDIVLREQQKLRHDGVLIILGDRNSDEGSAATEILLGKRELKEFVVGGGCRINKQLEADCAGALYRAPVLTGLLARCREQGVPVCAGGSYRYKGQWSLIDEILVRTEDTALFMDNKGAVKAGFLGQFAQGSDHRLLWAEMRLERGAVK